VRNRRDLDNQQSTDIAIVDVIDKLKKSQLVNGGYCQQGNSSNSYESVEIYVKRTSQIPYQQMGNVNSVKLEDGQEELFISRMMSHEKLISEKWINELPNKREFLLKILQEMKNEGVENIYDEESFIRVVLEKKSEMLGKSNSHGFNQSLVIPKDNMVGHVSRQNSLHVSENPAPSIEVMKYSMDQLSDKESSFVKEMMSCEEIKEFSIKEESMREIIREMKMQGIEDIFNKESFIRFVSEKKSKLNQVISHGSFDGFEVSASAEFSSSEVSFVKRMVSSEKINWIRELSSYKDKEAFMFSIIRKMKRGGIKKTCDEEYFVKRIHVEMKRIHEEEKYKQTQRMNGGGYQITRQEIITKYDNNGYQRMTGYRGNGGHGGGAAKMINDDGGDCYEDEFLGQAMQQKQQKMITGQHKYQRGGREGYANRRYY